MKGHFKSHLKNGYRIIQPWVIWSLGAAFFFAEYFARVDPSVIVTQLMNDFHVGAFALGSLSAFFYYPYIAMQLPVGTLVDRYGPHKLLAMAAAVCALAAYLFACSQHVWEAEFARALMGFSSAFAFVGTLKLATIWFEPKRLGLLAGLTQGIGMLGAAVGQGLFAFIVLRIGWRDTLSLIAIILLILAFLIFLVVRDRRPNLLSHRVAEASQLRVFESLLIVLRNKYSWRIAAYAGLIYAPTGAFAELWGPSFLHRVYGFTDQVAAVAVSVIFLGLAFGGPLVGWVSDRVGFRRPVLIGSAVLSLVLISLVLYIPHLSLVALLILLFFYGVSNMGVALSYAVSGELNPKPVAGISIAFTNMASVLIAAALQPVIGWVLEQKWDGKFYHGHPFYNAQNFQDAMCMLPIALVLAIVVAFSIKETHCTAK